ncbi:GroES-like protein [Mycena pura]|uniref:GroES-like protein n=1 Tax=Mycena pura TaxID=153505 RepID=A0AAD6YCY3_9AGAR|nr:GroES-like protein [Mycena pura]
MSFVPPYPATGVALQITELKQKTAQTLARVDIPQVLDGQEVLIKNGAAAQNPVDAKKVDDGSITTFPWTSGGDVAGEVIALGEDVENIKVGDRVASFLSRKTARHSGYQEFSIGNAPQTFKIPKYLGYEEASSIPLAFSTAVGAVFRDLIVPIPPAGSSLPLPPNREVPVLVWGGSSSVGAYAIQVLHLTGYKVVTTASPSNSEYVKSLGADIVVDYHDEEKAVEEIKKATDGKLSLVVDAISENHSTERAVKAFGPDGGIITTVLSVDDSVKKGRTDISIVSSGARIVYQDPKYLDAFRFLEETLEAKLLKPNKIEVLPKGLLSVDDGWNRQRAHKISGVKLVYRIADTPGLGDDVVMLPGLIVASGLVVFSAIVLLA